MIAGSDISPDIYELNVWEIVSSLNQISNFSSNSHIEIYLESLPIIVHFLNHVTELVLSQNCAKQQVKALVGGGIFYCSDLKFRAVHSFK